MIRQSGRIFTVFTPKALNSRFFSVAQDGVVEKIRVDDAEIGFVKHKRTVDGQPTKPLILLHGMLADSSRFDQTLETFRRNFDVICVDRRGRGHSSKAPAQSLEIEVKDLVSVVDHISKQYQSPVNLLGHSYGGLIALEAGLAAPANIARLVLYEPAFFPYGYNTTMRPQVMPLNYPCLAPMEITSINAPTHEGTQKLIEHLQQLLQENKHEEVLEVFYKQVLQMSPEALEDLKKVTTTPWASRVALAPTLPGEMLASNNYVVITKRLRQMNLTTLLLSGNLTSVRLQVTTEYLLDTLPRVWHVQMVGHGHNAMDTGAESLAWRVTRFLQETHYDS